MADDERPQRSGSSLHCAVMSMMYSMTSRREDLWGGNSSHEMKTCECRVFFGERDAGAS